MSWWIAHSRDWTEYDPRMWALNSHLLSFEDGMVQELDQQLTPKSCGWELFFRVAYRILILSDNCHLLLPAPTLLHVWAIGWVGHINTINEWTGSGNQWLSNYIMTLWKWVKRPSSLLRLCTLMTGEYWSEPAWTCVRDIGLSSPKYFQQTNKNMARVKVLPVHATKACGGVDISLHSFLTSVLNRDEWSTSHSVTREETGCTL
jgi:hypothetical protein